MRKLYYILNITYRTHTIISNLQYNIDKTIPFDFQHLRNSFIETGYKELEKFHIVWGSIKDDVIKEIKIEPFLVYQEDIL